MYTISPALKAHCPSLALGVLRARVQMPLRDDALQEQVAQEVARLAAALRVDDVASLPEVRAVRECYASLGKSPARYRGSAEALLRRVAQGKGLYRVNAVVDINNLVSLSSRHPVGSYDLSRLSPPFVLRVGQAGERYKGIGKDAIDLESLPVFADREGPFGSPTSDSERAMITERTVDLALVVLAFSGDSGLDSTLADAARLLTEYAGATDISTSIVG